MGQQQIRTWPSARKIYFGQEAQSKIVWFVLTERNYISMLMFCFDRIASTNYYALDFFFFCIKIKCAAYK